MADIVELPCVSDELIVERGNLEFNGAGALIASWPCQNDRNPGVSQAEMEIMFEQAFGVTEVVWLLSNPPGDLTTGHVDGIARYVDQGDPDAWIYEEAATIIQTAGFEVERIDIPGTVDYMGSPMAAIYVNWLVVNEAVIATGFGVPAWDAAAQARIEEFFPGRAIHVVETLELWYWGGGTHCVTNDQPTGEPVVAVDEPSGVAVAGMRLQSYPNPFNPSTNIRFQTERSGPVELVIYDVYGRVVRRLFDGLLSRGTHECNWDGTDDAGKSVVSGVYFYELRAGRAHQTRRMTLLR